MLPDYSFELRFPATARTSALHGLSRLCSEQTAAAIVAIASGHEEAEERNIALSVASGAPLHVAVWIRREADEVRITLWPTTRAMQIACVDSRALRSALVDLLANRQGIARYLDRGDGSLAEMWPNDEAPRGYEHELARQLE